MATAVETAAPPRAVPSATTLLFSATLLLSSGLLFFVQPMFAKMVLPKLGGTPAVWNTCMVFFQAALLAGYAYAHVSTRWLGVRKQAAAHCVLLLVPLIVLPIALPAGWTPPAHGNPVGWLLLLLTVTLGLPFFVVSTMGPLIQKWFTATGDRAAVDPYFLYAASNLGSMAALLCYPALVEPLWHLAAQSRGWAMGYGCFVALAFACAVRVWVSRSAATSVRADADPAPAWPTRLRWIALSFVPSSYLLGVTTFITSDIAAVPLLWVVPLALYLLTFIFVFAARPPVSHKAMVFALPVAVLAPLLFLITRASHPVWLILSLHLLAFFVAAMVCHGELARSRPGASHLTEFYLWMSVGGVLGGLFNGLIAPLVFSRMLEYPIAIVLACLMTPPRSRLRASDAMRPASPVSPGSRLLDVALPLLAGLLAWLIQRFVPADFKGGESMRFVLLGLPLLLVLGFVERPRRFALGVGALLLVHAFALPLSRSELLDIHRSFFGIHRVVQDQQHGFNELYHGTTIHGRQRIDRQTGQPTRPDLAMTYYHRTGPIGQLMTSLPPQRRRRVALVGLGVGSLAAYADAGSAFTFYEIDPAVKWAADDSGHFTFLRTARQRGASIDFVLGDARLTLAAAPDHAYDVIVLDAFSGDAIPVHLLTREALALYRAKLAPGGVLAVHISNLYLNLRPVLGHLAADAGCTAMYWGDATMSPADQAEGKLASQWVAVARNPADLQAVRMQGGWVDLPPSPGRKLWTDDFSNVLGVFRWRTGVDF